MKVLYLFLLFLFFVCQAIQAKPKLVKPTFFCEAVAYEIRSTEIERLPKALQKNYFKTKGDHHYGLLRCVSKESICYITLPLQLSLSCIKR